MKIYALLLNWKRPENLKKVIESIRQQSIKIEIYLWNNNPADKNTYNVDYQFNSPINLKCWMRWCMAINLKPGYIFTLDDDIMFGDCKVIEDLVNYYEKIENNKKEEDIILGWTGVVINNNTDYWMCNHIIGPKSQDTEVDIVKGRFMFMESKILDKVTLLREDEDDIKISSYSNLKIIPSLLRNRLINLDEMGVGLFQNPDHKENRRRAFNKYFQK